MMKTMMMLVTMTMMVMNTGEEETWQCVSRKYCENDWAILDCSRVNLYGKMDHEGGQESGYVITR